MAVWLNRSMCAGLAALVLGVGAAAQDAQAPAGTSDPGTGTAAPAVKRAPAEKQKKTREQRHEEKRDSKVVASKDTVKQQARLKKEGITKVAGGGVDATQPDKILYDKALKAIDKNRYDLARLQLQTLLATYPDSEYQMRAKLAFADSWYKEGGSASLTQAEQEYKDFITFFPNTPEAAEAQMRVGDIYFKQMDTPDRDYVKALHAEEEYRNMLQQFPDSPLIPEAKQHLREVQEVLADREAQIANFYMGHDNFPAAIARYQTVVDSYPLYSDEDLVLINLGDAYAAEARMVRAAKLPEGARAELIETYENRATELYDRVLTQYAASQHVEDARDRLEGLNRPVPSPTPEQLAASQALESSRRTYHLRDRVKLLVVKGPDTVQTAQIGEPSLVDPKATTAPSVSRKQESDYRLALAGKPIVDTVAAPAAATADAATPAAEVPLPAGGAAPTLQDLPGPGDTNANGSTPLNTAVPAGSTTTGGNGMSVEILNNTTNPDANTQLKDLGNGLKAVGPANAAPLPAAEAPAAAPDQVNDVAGSKTPVAQTPNANGKKNKPAPDFDKKDESSSKHKKKKGLDKLNPF